MRRFAVPLVALAVVTASVRGASAGALEGAVRTADGTPFPQLILKVTGPGGSRTVVTGLDGGYRAAALSPGDYRVSLELPGFVLSPEPRVTVADGDVRLDFTLAPAPVREQVVVSATRGDAALSTLGVSASVLDRVQISEREASSLVELLQDVPGVAVARAGGVGLQASAFVRGGESRFARILVDGVPVNEPGGFYNFGTQLPLELERVEVVRGAASSLYGTDALAGVILFVTRRAAPDEAPSVHAEADAGGFGWRRVEGGTSGRVGGLDWNAGLLRLKTDNEQPNSAFDETAGAFSGGARLGERWALRLLARLEDSTVGTPGPTAFGRPDLDASFERTDVVLGAQLRHKGDRVTHELRLGFAQSHQLSLNPEDSGSYTPRFGDRVGAFPVSDFPDPKGFQNNSARLSAGYQGELQVGARNLVTAGIDVERETGDIGSRADTLLSPERTNIGGYVQDRVVMGDRVFLTLGGRVERNDSYGTRVVPRAAVAVRLHGGTDATTIKASAGAGIKEPDFFQSFGVSFFAKGNPDLKPERSRTFDLSVEQRLFGSRLRAEATAFHHDYLDQIAFHIVDPATFQGTYINLGKTRGRGFELAVDAAPTDHLRLDARYTYLDGKVLVSASDFDPVYAVGQPLLRRPKHQASFSAQAERGRVSAGATLVVVGRRADSDFVGLGLTENDGYTRLDARVRVRVARGLEAFVVGENILDRQYMEVLGYPALGRSVRAGLRFRSGSTQRP
jgi:vitamin B12 transporter